MINVIGLGYIGLPTALMMASHGVEVIGTDYNEQLVNTLNAGHTTFKEDGIDELFHNALKAGIKFTTEYQKTDMYVVSVPTPYDKFSKKVDACYVVAAVKEVMKVCPKGSNRSYRVNCQSRNHRQVRTSCHRGERLQDW
ncbi:3-hydroxyacyl-CoA dehydrogenase NAD-binding domain-containing protein [Bacteroides thetaiotaomicron]|nr:3-hydroxyacyl-CoA dehydrogenase NAD-binding domain-containing protein [Bacteroides thetaiotaomicron]